MILPNGTVVAVVDGQRMRLFRNQGHEPAIDLADLPDPDLDAANTGSGSRHRSTSANPDRHRQAEDDFAAAAAGYLNREALDGRLESLVIVADPRSLGEMRRHFHEVLAAKLIGQIPKDLAGHSSEDIAKSIAAS